MQLSFIMPDNNSGILFKYLTSCTKNRHDNVVYSGPIVDVAIKFFLRIR